MVLLIAIKLSRGRPARAVLLGSPAPPLWLVESIRDPTDLLALPALALPLLSAAGTYLRGGVARRRWARMR